MKKLLFVGAAIAGLAVLALVVASFFLGSIVTRGVNGYAPGLTRTKVVLASASISPFSGSGTLRGFIIGNPAGWSDANLASFGSVHISVVPSSIVGDHVIINDIDVQAPEFSYETKVTSSNVNDLLRNIEQASGATATPRAVAKNGNPIKLEVRHLRVHDGVVRIGTGPAALRVSLPPVELRDIGGRENGIMPDELAANVMKTVTADIARAVAQAAGKAGATVGAAAAEEAKKAGGVVRGLFGGKK